jgi:hypothetical protein
MVSLADKLTKYWDIPEVLDVTVLNTEVSQDAVQRKL